MSGFIWDRQKNTSIDLIKQLVDSAERRGLPKAAFISILTLLSVKESPVRTEDLEMVEYEEDSRLLIVDAGPIQLTINDKGRFTWEYLA